MNNKLLIAAFVTTFSGITLVAAQETRPYGMLPIDKEQYCDAFHSQNCQRYAALFYAAQEAIEKTGVPHLTEKEAIELQELFDGITQDMLQQNHEVTIKDASILEDTQEKAQATAQDIAEKLEFPQSRE